MLSRSGTSMETKGLRLCPSQSDGRQVMVNKRKLCHLLAWGLVFSCSASLHAAVITLKIRAINPSRAEKQKTEVKRSLPKGVKPEDVVNADGLDVSYDVTTKTYCVQKEVELEPGKDRVFDVVIKDIWEIPEATLQELSSHASKLAEAMKGSDKADTAGSLKSVIDEGVKAVQARQAANAVGTVKPVDHIRAYESNMEALDRIRKDVGMLENLVIVVGKDPESILGLPRIPPPEESGNMGATGSVVTIHFKITNPSLTEKRKVPLKRDLPAEVKTPDVVDAGGLQVGFDTARNVGYVYLEDIELAPQESKVFDVKVRDPWAGLADRLPKLEGRAQDILKITADMESYKAVDAQARAILKDLGDLKGRKGPEGISPQYVAFARQQAEDVRGLETRLQRLEEIFQPREKPIKAGIPVMDVPRPDKRTTWVLIYIILGFLGVFSALFYFRWYGKGKSEKMNPSP